MGSCRYCGRGKEACQFCEDLGPLDWQAICDCGLWDFGSHLVDCEARKEFRYVIASDHEAAHVRL